MVMMKTMVMKRKKMMMKMWKSGEREAGRGRSQRCRGSA
jgi:hypothetical protein